MGKVENLIRDMMDYELGIDPRHRDTLEGLGTTKFIVPPPLEIWRACPRCGVESWHYLLQRRSDYKYHPDAEALETIQRECKYCEHKWPERVE